MMGLETVVRPQVFPNIRPALPRVLAPVDDPTQGFCTITGAGGGLIDLQHSVSGSSSTTEPQREEKRQVDRERTYQMDENGRINRKNFIDSERPKRIRFSDPDKTIKVIYADPPKADNVETLESDVTIDAGAS